MMFKLSSRGHKFSMMNDTQPLLEIMVTIHLDVYDNKVHVWSTNHHSDHYVLHCSCQGTKFMLDHTPYP